MCRRTTCKVCGKAGWAGCGAHVDHVLAGIPNDQRCRCTADDLAAAATGRSLLSRILGR